MSVTLAKKKTTNRTGRKSIGKVSGRAASAKAPRTSVRTSETEPIASHLPSITSEQTESARRKFEEGIVARGEAVEAGKPLPPGATHEIIGYRPDGSPILRRIRYSTR